MMKNAAQMLADAVDRDADVNALQQGSGNDVVHREMFSQIGTNYVANAPRQLEHLDNFALKEAQCPLLWSSGCSSCS